MLHLQLRSPPGASAARSLGVGCRPPGDVGTGGQFKFAAVTLESGHGLPPREGRGIGRPGGPGCVSRDCRRARAGLGMPPAPACQRGRRLRGRASAAAPFVRVCQRDQGRWPVSTPLYGDSERLGRKDNDGHGCIGGFEERVTDDFSHHSCPARQRAESRGGPPHGSCGIQGPGPVSMLLPLRRVNARIPVSWSQLSSWPLLISFYAGAPERCRQGWQSPGNPSR